MHLFVLIALVGCLEGAFGTEIPTDNFPNHVMLDTNFQLRWNFNKTHIVFETKVKTNGYVGFGISPNGKMAGSDIVIGWVKDGVVHFGDRHAISQVMPTLDSKQDWHLISGVETGQYTTLTMVRRLDTCDEEQDIAIKEGTTRVIYAYPPNDPVSDDSILWHGTRRGAKSLLLLDPPSSERESIALPDDVIHVEFINRNYSVPDRDTTYSCVTQKLPTLTEKHHVIKYEPIIQAGHENLVHHMILYFCRQPLKDSSVDLTFPCYSRQTPEDVDNHCQSVFTSWAIGGQAFNYPAHVGHSLGTEYDPVYFKLETHYDNPQRRSDFIDSSGLRFFLTKQLRKYDAGVLEAGVMVDGNHVIPPYNSHFLSQGYCHQDCLKEGMGSGTMNVFANLLHSHLLGRKLRTRIIRNGTELPPLQEDNNYDFNYQELRVLPKERVIEKGDGLIVECEYDSRQRTGITYGGLSTREEMCLSFLMYYPRNPLTLCLSRFQYDNVISNNQGIHSFIRNFNWTNQETQDQFKEIIHNSSIGNKCYGDNRHKSTYTVTQQIQVDVPYVPPEISCDDATATATPTTTPTGTTKDPDSASTAAASFLLCCILFSLVTAVTSFSS